MPDQCVVARQPRSEPAAPSTSDPVQTEVTYFAPSAWRRRKSSTSSSLTISSVPNPHGTQITSSCGQSAKLMVGVTVITQSITTVSLQLLILVTYTTLTTY